MVVRSVHEERKWKTSRGNEQVLYCSYLIKAVLNFSPCILRKRPQITQVVIIAMFLYLAENFVEKDARCWAPLEALDVQWVHASIIDWYKILLRL